MNPSQQKIIDALESTQATVDPRRANLSLISYSEQVDWHNQINEALSLAREMFGEQPEFIATRVLFPRFDQRVRLVSPVVYRTCDVDGVWEFRIDGSNERYEFQEAPYWIPVKP